MHKLKPNDFIVNIEKENKLKSIKYSDSLNSKNIKIIEHVIEYNFKNSIITISYTDHFRVKFENILPSINKDLNWLEKNDDFIKESISKEMFELKNKNWLSEGESKLSLKQFKENLKLSGIHYYSDKSMTVYFDENGMFSHISISLNITNDKLFKNIKLGG